LAGNDSGVVTRFAPAPTGALHIGGARTALFNYLWAKRNAGRFLLRFEDTDKARSSVRDEDAILEDLQWLGMAPDGDVLRQTSRGARHSEISRELKKLRLLYPCFCSGRTGEEPAAGHECRNIPAESAAARIDRGEPHCWRFKVARGGDFAYRDRLRGKISVPTDSIEDFAVERSDGSATYILAAVVDDHDSEISHVIRGEEHLSNVPKQEMIYSALGWIAPEWVHIPMVLDLDRHKLSKRHGAMSIGEYRACGWAPEALVSYLATLSWSGAPADRIAPLGELANMFALDSVAKFSPVHDERRMAHFGKMHMDKISDERLFELCRDELAPCFAPETPAYEKIALVKELRPPCATVAELAASVKNELSLKDCAGSEKTPDWLEELRVQLCDIGETDWRAERISDAMKTFARKRSLKGRDFFHPVRFILTGSPQGAPIGLILSCVGKEESLRRLKRVQDHRLGGDNFE
jgi:glutamyl-tRNA synthetase